MAFPAYQFINIPNESAPVITSENSSIISSEIVTGIDILPISTIFPSNPRIIGELLPPIEIKVCNQKVDDIPVILATLLKMDIPNQIDSCFITHGARCGLSLGWLITVWLVYIISQHDHRMNHVRDWVLKRHDILECLIGQSISETDFTDDRLADGLRYLSQLTSWNSVRARTFTTHNSCL